MGGRKPSSLRSVVGNLTPIRSERQQLHAAIEDQSPERIAQTTLNLFRGSKHAVSNLAMAIDMRNMFRKAAGRPPSEHEAKDYVTDFWNDVKAKRKIESQPEIDRILIDSATKILKRRGKK